MNTNYHTHSLYCDGKDPLPAYVKTAEALHFTQLGFSSHAYVPNTDFGISYENLPRYCAEIDTLQKNTDILLLKGLECDYIPGISTPFDQLRNDYGLDYIIGGVHLVRPPHGDRLWFIDGRDVRIYDDGLKELFGGNVKVAVTTFWEQTFEMLETEHLDIIAHLDKIKMHNQNRYFTEDEKWYRDLAEKAVRLMHQHDVVMEINTRGIYKKRCDSFYPSTDILKMSRKYDIPVVVSTDAHKADEIALLGDEARLELKRCGFENVVHYDVKKGKFV